MKQCKACGNEIAKKGKVVCPKCGRVSKKAFYKRWYSIVGVIILLSIVTTNRGGNEKSIKTEEIGMSKDKTTIEKTPSIKVRAGDMVDDLSSNALKASQTYNKKYIEVTGELKSIDSAGKYFSIGKENEMFSFTNITCRIKKEHLEKVMEFSEGEIITVVGEITSVGEILGYTLNVDVIK